MMDLVKVFIELAIFPWEYFSISINVLLLIITQSQYNLKILILKLKEYFIIPTRLISHSIIANKKVYMITFTSAYKTSNANKISDQKLKFKGNA